jgi:uncharacterized membrane protein YkvA (DUF1232 family)
MSHVSCTTYAVEPHLPNFVRLIWRLWHDPRVPLRLKALIIGAVVYFFLPVDFLADFLSLVGQVDDITLLLLSGYFFIRWSPKAVVAEHVAAIDADFRAKFGQWRS